MLSKAAGAGAGAGIPNAAALSSPTSIALTNLAPAEAGNTTEPRFGDILQNVQNQYGAKPQKPREAKKQLDKDDFLKIMVTQMKHQDPSAPFKAEQFATQLAQFTSVEQMQNMNQTLTKIANQSNPLERLAMTNLIGKSVTVDREQFPHTQGQAENLSFALPRSATKTQVAIADEKGEVIFEKDLGPMKQGDQNFHWDGMRAGGLPVKSGTFFYKITATDEHDATIEMNNRIRARVVGVSFEGNEPALLVGDPASPQKVSMKTLSRIDSDLEGAGLVPGAQSLSAAVSGGAPRPAPSEAKPAIQTVAPEGAGKPSFFSFRKGEGSANLDPNRLTPEVRQALAQYEKNRAEFENEKAESRGNSGEAFPNGLSDPEQQGGKIQPTAGKNKPVAGTQKPVAR